MTSGIGSLGADRPILDPIKVIKTGPGFDIEGDPLSPLEVELAKFHYIRDPAIGTFTGEPTQVAPTRSD